MRTSVTDPLIQLLAFPSIEAVVADLPGCAVVAGYVVALFVACELLRRWADVRTEYTRKLSHLGAGVIVMAMPWLVSEPWSVTLLGVAMGGLLIGGRLTGWLSSVHGVSRRTGGAYYYPVAVTLLFWLSKGDPLLFCLPLAIMAIADTGAALVGSERGRNRFAVMDGQRSLEGSFTFFGLAFTITAGVLAIAGVPGWPGTLLITLVVALFTTAVEAISVRGTDNILIPYAAWLVLERTLRLGLDEMSAWIGGMLVALVLVMATARAAKATTAGAVTTFLLATLAMALGGWLWLWPLLTISAMYFATRSRGLRLDLSLVFPYTAASLVVMLAFAHTEGEGEWEGLYAVYLATVAANAALACWIAAPTRLIALYPATIITLVGPALYMGQSIPVSAVALTGLAAIPLHNLIKHSAMPAGRRAAATLAASALVWSVL